MAADLLADPSTATRAELAYRIEESVAQAGVLARLVSKAASSPALQSTLTAFAEYEATIESTSEMLAKINEGMLALDEAVDDCQRSLAPAAPTSPSSQAPELSEPAAAATPTASIGVASEAAGDDATTP